MESNPTVRVFRGSIALTNDGENPLLITYNKEIYYSDQLDTGKAPLDGNLIITETEPKIWPVRIYYNGIRYFPKLNFLPSYKK